MVTSACMVLNQDGLEFRYILEFIARTCQLPLSRRSRQPFFLNPSICFCTAERFTDKCSAISVNVAKGFSQRKASRRLPFSLLKLMRFQQWEERFPVFIYFFYLHNCTTCLSGLYTTFLSGVRTTFLLAKIVLFSETTFICLHIFIIISKKQAEAW